MQIEKLVSHLRQIQEGFAKAAEEETAWEDYEKCYYLRGKVEGLEHAIKLVLKETEKCQLP